MNEKSDTAVRPEAGSTSAVSAKADEIPGHSSTLETPADRPTLFERLSGYFKQRNGSNLREEIADALAVADSDGEAFSTAERTMLNNILRLREVRVEDVMVPRADIEAIELSTSLGELLVLFEQSGHSRMPVYADTLDDPRGMVHIRDAVAHVTRTAKAKKSRSRKAAPVALDLTAVDLTKSVGDLNLIRTVLFVPPSMLASDLMARMQATRTQIALVIDEYGGTDGLVSLEDLVEMVVGDIEDEHDDDEAPLIVQNGDGDYTVDAKAEIEDVARMIGGNFAPGEHGEYVDTIGGMIFNALGRVPGRGEVVQPIPGFEFHVLDADPRRVKRVRIVEKAARARRPARAEAEPEA